MSERIRCAATTARGERCSFPPWAGRDLCLVHAAGSGDAEAKAELGRNGSKGRASQNAELMRAREAEAADITLRSLPELQDGLERAYRMAVTSTKESKTVRANCMVRIIAQAAELLKTADLEQRCRELEAMLVERHPELRKQLRSVP